jgi:putative aldouronate transport system permease protein
MNMKEDRITKFVSHCVLMIFSLACLLPFLLLIIASVSSENSIIKYGYSFLPKEFSMDAYKYLLSDAAYLLHAYGITIFVTVVGTALSLLITMLLAYPLSRKDYPLRKPVTFLVFLTMLFNGGLVPTYLLYTMVLGIKNTLLALLVPNLLMSAMNVLLARTFFMSNIPSAIIESASIDGASELKIFASIVMPCSLPILATIGLFVGVGYWNDWYNGLIYLTDANLFNIQNVLNNMLQNIQFLQSHSSVSSDMSSAVDKLPQTTVKMAVAVVGILPIILVYPFFQKYFVKGIVIGAVKG